MQKLGLMDRLVLLCKMRKLTQPGRLEVGAAVVRSVQLWSGRCSCGEVGAAVVNRCSCGEIIAAVVRSVQLW